MNTPSLKDRVAQFFAELLPTTVVTRLDLRQVHAAVAHTVTADQVHEIFRAAETGQPEKLFALYRDIVLAHAHLQGRFADRKRAVLGDTLALQPFDKTKPEDVAAKDALWPVTQHLDWIAACNHLLDAALWPVAVVEKVYRPSSVPGQRYELARLVPVPHDLLDFQTGILRIKDTDDQGNLLSTTHEASPYRYIVHRGHLLTTPDHWGGPMRSLVWWWLLATQDREWWARFLDRYGSGFLLGKYERGDEDSRGVLQAAFAYATRVGGLVVTRETDVEIKQAATRDGGEAFAAFHAVCNREISKLIVGQTLSADAQGTGLGSGVAGSQEEVRQDVRQFDAKLLGATITTQLASQFLQINGLAGRAPIFVWGTMSPAELKAYADFLTSLKSAGLELTDEGVESLSERFGMPLQRVAAPPSPFQPFSVLAHSAAGLKATETMAAAAAANLARTLGKHHAPILQFARESRSPEEWLSRVEAYCARQTPREAAKIIEEVLIAEAANGVADTGRH